MPKKNTVKPAKLTMWQNRLKQSDSYWLDEVDRMIIGPGLQIVTPDMFGSAGEIFTTFN